MCGCNADGARQAHIGHLPDRALVGRAGAGLPLKASSVAELGDELRDRLIAAASRARSGHVERPALGGHGALPRERQRRRPGHESLQHIVTSRPRRPPGVRVRHDRVNGAQGVEVCPRPAALGREEERRPDLHADGAELERGAHGLRVGYVRHFHETDMIADPQVAAALDEVARTLKQEGATVRDITLPPLHEIAGVQRVIMQAESWAIHAAWLRKRPGDYAESTRRKLMSGAFLSAGDYVHAQRHRPQMIDAIDAVLREVDVLLTANTMDPACRIDDAESLARTYPRQARSPFNLTGHPALAMMCGRSKAGLPLSVQFVGRAHDEVTLLRAAAAYERATQWHTQRPPAF